MIAGIWRGETRLVDARVDADYVPSTGIEGYRGTAGNLGAWVLWRAVGDRARFLTLSLWESEEAIRAFAGLDIERAVFYPEDDRVLLSPELRARHDQVGRGISRDG